MQDQVLTQSIMVFFSLGHHKGTESEQASLYYHSNACDSDQEESEIQALQYWYR